MKENMEQHFELPVDYNGQKHFYKGTRIVYSYSQKFHIDVNGQIVIFEADEEGNYRAVLNYEDIDNKKKFDIDLLKRIARSIEEIVNKLQR